MPTSRSTSAREKDYGEMIIMWFEIVPVSNTTSPSHNKSIKKHSNITLEQQHSAFPHSVSLLTVCWHRFRSMHPRSTALRQTTTLDDDNILRTAGHTRAPLLNARTHSFTHSRTHIGASTAIHGRQTLSCTAERDERGGRHCVTWAAGKGKVR